MEKSTKNLQASKRNHCTKQQQLKAASTQDNFETVRKIMFRVLRGSHARMQNETIYQQAVKHNHINGQLEFYELFVDCSVLRSRYGTQLIDLDLFVHFCVCGSCYTLHKEYAAI